MGNACAGKADQSMEQAELHHLIMRKAKDKYGGMPLNSTEAAARGLTEDSAFGGVEDSLVSLIEPSEEPQSSGGAQAAPSEEVIIHKLMGIKEIEKEM